MNSQILKTVLLLPMLLYAALALKPTTVAQRGEQPVETRVLGLLNQDTPDTIVAPESVAVGESFEVKITTTGGGCERAGDTGVLLSEDGATVMVYDFTTATRPGVACTMIFKRFPHTTTLRFTKLGTAVIRVWGRRMGADLPPAGAPNVLERRVAVK
jgi:hypothetical protein